MARCYRSPPIVRLHPVCPVALRKGFLGARKLPLARKQVHNRGGRDCLVVLTISFRDVGVSAGRDITLHMEAFLLEFNPDCRPIGPPIDLAWFQVGRKTGKGWLVDGFWCP